MMEALIKEVVTWIGKKVREVTDNGRRGHLAIKEEMEEKEHPTDQIGTPGANERDLDI